MTQAVGTPPVASPRAISELPNRLAEAAAGNALWNAVARECPGVWFRGTGPDSAQSVSRSIDTTPELLVPLQGRDMWLRVPVKYRSLAGRHQFGAPVILAPAPDSPGWEVDLPSAAALVIGEPALVDVVAPKERWCFLRRLCQSLMTLSDALEVRVDDWSKVYDEPLHFIAAEQALFLGHPLHPTAKSRDEFSAADTRVYSPEFRGAFGLAWFAVDPELIESGAEPPFNANSCARQLLQNDPTLPDGIADRLDENGTWALLPAHPWQAELLLRHPVTRAYQRDGRVRYLGELGRAWRATSSVRSIYAAHSPWMLKCSLSVRLTNADRTLAPTEPARGKDVHRIVTSAAGVALRTAYPAFHVLNEPAHLALRDPTGTPMHEACVLFRNNPFQGELGNGVEMMATLCQDDLLRGGSRLSRLVAGAAERNGRPSPSVARAWFDRFLSIAVEPILVARANFGLLFGAHQQNMLLRLSGGFPVASYYRDCFGTFLVPELHSGLAIVDPETVADRAWLIPRETGDRLLAHNLIHNNVLNVVATLGHSGLVEEATLLTLLRLRLHQLRRRPLVDGSFIDYLLDRPTVAAKANFRTILHDINENVANGASRQTPTFVDLRNPLLHLSHGGPHG